MAQERSGGLEVDIDTAYNFKVLFGIGSGMPPMTHHTAGMALLPGALFQDYKIEPRVLDLFSATDVEAPTVAKVRKARKDFINAIKLDKVSPVQPTVIRYYGVNPNKPVQFYGYIDSGMGFDLSSGMVDKPTARFICYDPFCYETHTGSSVLSSVAVLSGATPADYIARKINGTWYNISTDFNDTIYALAKGVDGCIYIGGNFDFASGSHITKWNPYTSTLSTLAHGGDEGTDDTVRALAVAPNGDVYTGGSFHLAAGVANTVHIAYWDISAGDFVALTTGSDADCYCMCFGPDGSLYVGGAFHLAGGVANTVHIAKWDGTAWSALGTGTDDIVTAIAVAPNGDVYATGNFPNAGGVAVNGFAKWNGTTWSALGTGLDAGSIFGGALAIDKAGNVYVGGVFPTVDGVTCNNIAKWNGKTVEALGSGITGGGAGVSALVFDENGLLIVGGIFTSAGGLVANNIAVWNGTTWAHIDVLLPGAPTIYELLSVNNGLYIGYDTAGTAYASYLNTVNNNGSSSAYPVIKIHRSGGTSGIAEYLKSETTGDCLLLNYSLLDAETLTIDLTPGNRSIKSSFFGDVWRAVLRSSDLSSFRLLPGANSIGLFVMPGGGATITCWWEWPITHIGADMVAA